MARSICEFWQKPGLRHWVECLGFLIITAEEVSEDIENELREGFNP